jgi:uncharacterized membrane protein HdeD (DUF308 family)
MSVASAPFAVKRSFGWSIAISILMIVAGFLAIVVPPAAGIAVDIVVGWLLLFSAGAHFAYAWHIRKSKGALWEVLLGILYAFVGILLLLNPLVGLVSVTLALAAYLLVDGILELILSYRLRPAPGTGWLLFDGIVTLILAFMIWRTWPVSSEWAIGILVGISMLFSGISRLMVSIAARHLVTELA